MSKKAENVSSTYIDYIKNLNLHKKKKLELYLSRKLKTKDYMTRLRHRGYSDHIDSYCKDAVDVIILNAYGKKLLIIYIPGEDLEVLKKEGFEESDSLTFTKLKTMNPSVLLNKCSANKYTIIPYSEKEVLQLWNCPCRLKAQTKYDEDYGDIYEWGVCVHRGNRYGDTSNFYVIGNLKLNR